MTGLQTQKEAGSKITRLKSRVTINRYLKCKGKSGSEYFHISQRHQGLLKQGWVKVRELLSTSTLSDLINAFEVAGVSETVAREALRRAANKLGQSCRFVKRDSH